MLRIFLLLIVVAFVLGLLGLGMANADEPLVVGMDVYPASGDASQSALYTFSGQRLPGGRATFLYNPTGAPAGLDVTHFLTGVTKWNAYSANLQVANGGVTSFSSGLCSGSQQDGVNTINWQVGAAFGQACWWSGTGECDIVIGTAFGNADLAVVLAHEVGHCLGLAHSTIPTALMWPVYNGSGGPQADDIAGLCTLYGGCGLPITPTPQPSATTPATATPTAIPTPTQPPQPTPTALPRGCARYVGLPFCAVIPGLAKD